MSESHPEVENVDVKIDLAEMLTGGVIVSVSNDEEAKIAQDAGARAVIISERGISDHPDKVIRMTQPEIIQKIQQSVSIPVIAKCRIGHFAEAQILESMFVDFIDESEVLTPVDENFINKHGFRTPFVSGCSDLATALRRIEEGAVMLRTAGENGEIGNIARTVKCIRAVFQGLRSLMGMDRAELISEAHRIQAPLGLLEHIVQVGNLPVPFFASGGILTPADAALMIQLGAESVFVDLEIYQSEDPLEGIKAIVEAIEHYRHSEKLTEDSLDDVNQMESENRAISEASF